MVQTREIRKECSERVKSFLVETGNKNRYPDIFIHFVIEDARRGFVYLYQKKPLYQSKKHIAFQSIPELALIVESLGKEWKRSR